MSDRMLPRSNKALEIVLIVACAVAAGAALDAFGLPAAWLSGATLASAGLALAGRTLAIPNQSRDFLFFMLGLSMGAGVTPEAVDRIGDYPLSLAILAVTVVAVVLVVMAFLRRVAGFDRLTAFFAAVPGALSYVVIAASATKADLRKVVVTQTLRVVLLVAVLPALITLGTPEPLAPPPATSASARDLALLVAGGLLGSLLATVVKVPSGVLTGAFFASAALHGSGVVGGNWPEPVLVACFIALGILIGQRFAGTTPAELLSITRAGLGAFALAVLVAGAGALTVVALTDIALGPALLAFAPGGLEAMAVLSFALGLDPAYVSIHQLARFIAIALVLPLIIRRLSKY